MSKSPEIDSVVGNSGSPELALNDFSTTRRGFIGGAAGVTGATLAGVLSHSVASATRAEAATAAAAAETFNRPFLVVDDIPTALLSVEGGGPYADVVSEPGSPYSDKKPGETQHEPLDLVPTALTKPLFNWIQTSWKGSLETTDGSIVLVDPDFKGLSRRNFKGGILTECTVPKLDAASKDPARFRLQVTPEHTEWADEAGTLKGSVGGKQKQWLVSNFRPTIDGVDCKRVNKIDSFTVKQAVADGSVDVSPLRVTFGAASIKTWMKWFNQMVIGGEEVEKSGKLEFLAPDLVDVLAEINFGNLGIVRLTEDYESRELIRRMTAELYCEEISIS